MVDKLTPEFLREIQWVLLANPRFEFTCCVAGIVSKWAGHGYDSVAKNEYIDILIDLGAITARHSPMLHGWDNEGNLMIRAMFLEFLALEMEDN